MFISVIVCTFNRAASLRETLKSFACRSNLAEPQWEMIIVDNNSSDETPAVCREFVERYPVIFRVLQQPQQGKSHALNLGIASAKGEILALTDDDVLCSPGYVAGIREVFTNYTVDAAQGRILLDCEGGIPDYLHRDLALFMSSRDYGDQVLKWEQNLTGTNMVVRARVFSEIGGFTPELGAGAVGFAEDTEFSQRIRRAGFRLIYAPQILVRHQLPRARLTRRMFRERYFRMGRSNALRVQLPAPLWRFGLYVIKQGLLTEPAALWQRLSGRPADALRAQCAVCELAGFWWQHLLLMARPQSRQTNPAPPAT